LKKGIQRREGAKNLPFPGNTARSIAVAGDTGLPGAGQAKTGRLLKRNIHLGKAARRGCIYGGHNPFNVTPQTWPLCVSENDDWDFPTC